MTDRNEVANHEKLIDAAEAMTADEIHQHPMAALDKLRALARELRDAEKAHTPVCEMCRWENGFGARKPLSHTCEKDLSTDDFPHGHPEMDPTDNEREALIQEWANIHQGPDAHAVLLEMLPIGDQMSLALRDALRDLAALRRSEVVPESSADDWAEVELQGVPPEPNAEPKPTLNQRIVDIASRQRSWFIEKADEVLARIKTDTSEDVMLYHDAVSVLVAAKQMYELVGTATLEPQGEPSDAEIEAARYRERLGDLEGADDEVLAHTRTIAERAQGEPSDAPTVQFVARKGGKSQALIDQMLAQANDQGIRVEVVYPQDEPSFEAPEPSAELRKPYTPTSESTDDPGGRLFRSRTYKALAERDFTGHMDEGRRTAFYEGWSAREQWQSHPEPQGEPSDALSVGVSVTLAGLRDRVAFNSKTHGDDAWWRGHVQGMKDAVDEVEGAALRASWEVR